MKNICFAGTLNDASENLEMTFSRFKDLESELTSFSFGALLCPPVRLNPYTLITGKGVI